MGNNMADTVVYSFLGPPGSGKGTLARRCAQALGFKVLSTGDLCRKHVASGSSVGKKIKDCLLQGHLIPDFLITGMVAEWLDNALTAAVPVILDGYPRTKRQAEDFLHLLDERFPNAYFTILSFDISTEEIVRRLEKRLVCKNKSCQAIYSAIIPPKKENTCDVCGGVVARRRDDRASVVRERLRHHPASQESLLNLYRDKKVPIEKRWNG